MHRSRQTIPSASSGPEAPIAEPYLALVIEDSLEIANTLVELLCDAGLPACSVRNGKAALERLDAGLKPRVVILDLRTPTTTGWKWLVALRASPRYEGLSIIALSGELEERAYELADTTFLKFPSFEALHAAVIKLLH